MENNLNLQYVIINQFKLYTIVLHANEKDLCSRLDMHFLLSAAPTCKVAVIIEGNDLSFYLNMYAAIFFAYWIDILL